MKQYGGSPDEEGCQPRAGQDGEPGRKQGDKARSERRGDGVLSRLPLEKEKRILDAAVKEFGEKGYENASTNIIAREAGISKGLLFHYYGSKEALFLWVFDRCVEDYLGYFFRNLGELPNDPVGRLMRWGTVKVRLLAQDPLVYRLVSSIMDDVPKGVRAGLAARQAALTERLMPVFMKDIDYSALRPGVNPRTALQFILLVVNALGDRFLRSARSRPDRGLADLDAALKELEEYGDLMRKGLYRG